MKLTLSNYEPDPLEIEIEDKGANGKVVTSTIELWDYDSLSQRDQVMLDHLNRRVEEIELKAQRHASGAGSDITDEEDQEHKDAIYKMAEIVCKEGDVSAWKQSTRAAVVKAFFIRHLQHSPKGQLQTWYIMEATRNLQNRNGSAPSSSTTSPQRTRSTGGKKRR